MDRTVACREVLLGLSKGPAEGRGDGRDAAIAGSKETRDGGAVRSKRRDDVRLGNKKL